MDMKKIFKDLTKTVILALLWFTSAYFAAEAWLPTTWALNCGVINIVISMMALILIVRTEEGAKLFYDGPSNGGWIIIAIVWSIPVAIFTAGIAWWIVRFVLQWLGLWYL
jgi:hypothetical protein